MSRKTITKNCALVISLAILCVTFAACSHVSSSGAQNSRAGAGKTLTADYQKPETVGKIASDEIKESSGIAASLCQANVFWTHNDSGDDAFLFAVSGTGEKLGTYKVAAAKNIDWEGIAAQKNARGECFLYIGDIGNNERLRGEMIVYTIREPRVAAADKSSSKKNPVETETAQQIRFEYPDIRHDAETLLVHPQTGDIYVLSKSLSQPSGVYKLRANFDLRKTNTLEKIADLAVPAVPNGLLTDGGIAPDGKSVIICDYFNGYEITLPANAKNFDDIWTQTPLTIDLGAREQGEAVTYAPDGKSVYATSEKKNQPLVRAVKN